MTNTEKQADNSRHPSRNWLKGLLGPNGQCYLVGGAVRDELLNLPVMDSDWVLVGVSKQDMRRLGFKEVGQDFGVFLHPETGEEYALARTERKIGPGYCGFEVEANENVSLEKDLLRRDLTINAIAKDENGVIIDPLGGCAHIKQRLLHHVSPAFTEDPLRLLRVARFYARFYNLDFKVADETLLLLKNMVDEGEVDTLVPERIWKECVSAMKSSHPSQFFILLKSIGAMPVVFPELMFVFDNNNYILKLMDQFASQNYDPQMVFSCLWFSEQADKEGLDAICKRLNLPKSYQKIMSYCFISRVLFNSDWQVDNIAFVLDTLGLWGHKDKINIWLGLMDKLSRSGINDYIPKKVEWLEKLIKHVVLPFNPKEYLKLKPANIAVGEYLKAKRFDVIEAYFKQNSLQ